MMYCDNTQKELRLYLDRTENTFNKLLSEYDGQAVIKTCLDLGFPHDIIRIAGGFATGAYVEWTSNEPIIPVDTCVNVCSCSFFEITKDIRNIFNKSMFDDMTRSLRRGIYVDNFHRGNHFIAFLQSLKTGKLYLLLHSSASEFKDNFNGLYPVRKNWYYENIQKFYNGNNSYIRYIKGKDAELFYHLAENLLKFNENRHEFFAQLLLRNAASINDVTHYHHYYMPNEQSVVMGSHIVSENQTSPILSVPGANIYMVQFKAAKERNLYINDKQFLTPHGWGKRHKGTPILQLDVESNTFSLDDYTYNIEYGESLRAHPSLELRDFETEYENRKQSFLKHLDDIYDYTLIDELKQIASYNKSGVIIW